MGRLQGDVPPVSTTNNPLYQETTPPCPPPQPHHAPPPPPPPHPAQFSQQPNNIINSNNANSVGVSYYNSQNQPNMMVPPGPPAQPTSMPAVSMQNNNVQGSAQYGGGGSVHGPAGGNNMGMMNQVGGRPMAVPLNSPNTPGRMPTPNVYPNNSNQPAGLSLFRPRPGGAGRRFTGTNPWTTGLFNCMDNPSNAFITALFPCITFGQIAEILDRGATTCVTSGIMYAASPCLISRPYRRKLRQMFGLLEVPAQDWMVHSMFEPCALCQEYRELHNRGIDPALGDKNFRVLIESFSVLYVYIVVSFKLSMYRHMSWLIRYNNTNIRDF